MNDAPSPTTNRFSSAVKLGFHVFPAKARDKTPAMAWKKYQDDAPSDAEITNWDASEFNVCIVTGSPSGIVVLDVDSPEAHKLVDALGLPRTPQVRTSRGYHLYFRCPGFSIRNGVMIGGEKLDVRGDGGYVIGAGSVHPNGTKYEWTISPDEEAFAAFPSQLIELLNGRKMPIVHSPAGAAAVVLPSTGAAGMDRYFEEKLGKAREAIAAAEQGQRNDTLFANAAGMAARVSAANLDWQPFADALALSGRSVGLEDKEIERTLESAWGNGSSRPTAWIRVATEHVYLAAQERFYHLLSGTDLKPAGFNGHFGHLYWHDDGSFAHYLLRADRVRKVHDLTYDPHCERRYTESRGRQWLNTFRPSEVRATPGDFSPFVDFLTGLVLDDDEREHLVKMLAFIVRNPGQKLRYALLMRTAMQGVGKSMLIDILSDLLGRHNVRKTTSKELGSDFQGYLPEKLLIVCEELNIGVGQRAYNDLKDMITADVATVNEKYLRPREWPLYATFVFLSNLEAPILIEQHDRRVFYIDSAAQRRDPLYYAGFATWSKQNVGVIRHYLDGVDLAGFNQFEAPPLTPSKLKLIARSRSELVQELILAISERQGSFDRDVVTLDQVFFELRPYMGGKTRTQVVRALRETGALALGQQRIGLMARASLWAIRNTAYWEFTDAASRAQEAQSVVGVFADLDGTGIWVGHLSQFPGVSGVADC